MTKKDYELIASILKTTNEWALSLEEDVYQIICGNFSNRLSREDPKFDYQKFLQACGIEEKPIRDNTVFHSDGRQTTLQ